MKKTANRKRKARRSKSLRAEYLFDYTKSKANRFAKIGRQRLAVVLEPDVAEVFDSSRAVNKMLRSVIAATPTSATPRTSRRRAS
jgi:hypothetical protein